MSLMLFPVITETERQLPFYLTGVGCHYPQEHVKRDQGYPAFQWIQCHHGEGRLLLDGNLYPVKPQQGMFLYPNTPHEYYGVVETWEVDWIGFDGHRAESVIKAIGLEKSGVFFVNQGDLLLNKIRRVLAVAQSGRPFSGMECSVLIYELILELFKNTSSNQEDSILRQYSRMKPLLDYIEANYSRVITLEELAATIKVTPQHLCLLFKNTYKIRPFVYLNKVRISKSKDLMFSRRNLQIQDIAKLVGYDNVSYYCAVFRNIEGVSPGKFRRLHGI